jgi:uncharacterized protein
MSHDICHFEIPAPDMAEAKRFYETVFGWNVELWGDGGYAIVKTSEGALGGGLNGTESAVEGGCVLIIECEDIPAMLERVAANGGKGITEKTAIADGQMGYFCYFRDSLGNKLGLWSKT